MYGGGYTFEGIRQDDLTEDPEKLAGFEARIARGEKIEPADWMPQLYRKQPELKCRPQVGGFPRVATSHRLMR